MTVRPVICAGDARRRVGHPPQRRVGRHKRLRGRLRPMVVTARGRWSHAPRPVVGNHFVTANRSTLAARAVYMHRPNGFYRPGYAYYHNWHADWHHGYWHGWYSRPWLWFGTGVAAGWLLAPGENIVYSNPYYFAPPPQVVPVFDYSQPIPVPASVASSIRGLAICPSAEPIASAGTVATPNRSLPMAAADATAAAAAKLLDDARQAFAANDYGRASNWSTRPSKQQPKDTTLHEFRAHSVCPEGSTPRRRRRSTQSSPWGLAGTGTSSGHSIPTPTFTPHSCGPSSNSRRPTPRMPPPGSCSLTSTWSSIPGRRRQNPPERGERCSPTTSWPPICSKCSTRRGGSTRPRDLRRITRWKRGWTCVKWARRYRSRFRTLRYVLSAQLSIFLLGRNVFVSLLFVGPTPYAIRQKDGLHI